MDVTQIESLLEKVGIIKKKYDDLAEYTGENYNVFNILRLSEKELIHSAFIANLLNVKGEHGQKDIFLRLFLDEIKELFTNNEQNKEVLEKFETSRSSVEEEVHLGSINYDSVEGGRVDIVLKDGSNQIVIENKIGAGDQYMQLSRYNTHFFKAPIIYLTLSGGEPSDSSRGKLKNGVDFICVSYRQNITNWIEKCIKEMANKPIIRETLNQYLFLVKQLTNQTTNDKMEEEIIKLIINNKESVKTILEAHNTLDIELKKKIGQIYDFFQTSRFKEELENKIKGASFSGDLRVRLWPYEGHQLLNFDLIRGKEKNDIVYTLELNDYALNGTISTCVFSTHNLYKIQIEDIVEKNSLKPKEYGYEESNEEIIEDVIKRYTTVLRVLSEK